MRKPLHMGLLSLVVLASFNLAAQAQFRGGPPGGGGGFGGPGGGVLQDENVKRELGLVDEQVTKIQAINEKAQAEMRDLFSGMRDMRDLPEDERRARFDELRQKMTARNEVVQREINDVLLPQQVERLKQITVQNQLRRSGTSDALTQGPLAEELALSDADKERIKKAAETAEAELRQKTDQLREEARQKIISVLSPAQQAKFRQLTGNPIQFSQPQFGGGRGGFGGGRGGPGGGGPGGGNRGGGTQLQRPADGD